MLLVQLWSWGFLSAVQLQRICAAAVKDGLSHPEILALASIGSWGQWPNNCHRDLVRKLGKPNLPSPFSWRVSMTGFRTFPKVRNILLPFMLPHLLFGWMYHKCRGAFNHLIAGEPGALASFWSNVDNDPRMVGHPIHEKTNREQGYPIALHTDAVPTVKVGKPGTSSLDCISWNSLLVTGATLDIKFLIFLYFHSYVL